VSFKTNKRAVQILLVIFVAALAVPLIHRGLKIFLADRIMRSEETVESFTRALRYTPSNAEFWWKRGRLRHYSVKDVNIAQALNDYRQALALNPRLSQAWVDLADVYERMGKLSEAEAALEKAFETRPYSPLIRWQAGNFFLRRDNLPKMYECFKLASQYDIEKLGIAIELAWKVDPDHAGILEKLVPDSLPCNLRFLAFLVARDELDLAHPAWRRCMRNEIPSDFEFKPSAAFRYIDCLLLKNRAMEAMQIWDEALRKARVGLSDARMKTAADGRQPAESPELVWNGSFENDILQGGFDWRYQNSPAVQFSIDAGIRVDNLKSLRVTFNGANLSSDFLNQIIPVLVSGSYLLSCFLKTEGLTTDQMPFILVRGYPDASAVTTRSAPFPATTDWVKLSIPFAVAEGRRAVQIALRRDKSSKFDNQIRGSFWLDGISIRNQQTTSRLN